MPKKTTTEAKRYKSSDIEQMLCDAFELIDGDQEYLQDALEIPPGTRLSAERFSDAGVLSGNKGIVLEIGGDEFQITIVRSK